MRTVRGRLLLALAAAAGGGGVVLSWVVAHRSLYGNRWAFEMLLVAWVPLWILAAGAARRLPLRWSVITVIVVAVLLRAAAATATGPSISNDLYRYSWDAHVQLSGVDPYRYPPASPQLAGLRTPNFFPDVAGCRRIGQPSGCTVMNRPEARTIYPAAAQAWFVVVHLVIPGDAGSRPWQIAGGLVDVAAIVLMALILCDQGGDPRQVAWYALSPLPVVEFAGNGHVDGFALLLILASLLALRRQHRATAGVLIGLAAMVKFYPALGVIAGWRLGRARFAVAAAVTAIVVEAPHVIAVGPKVLGYLPGYLQEERYTSGGRFLLLGLLSLPGTAELALAGVCITMAVVAVARARLDPATGLAVLLGVLIFVATPVQPWYAVAAAGVATAAGAPWLLVAAALPEFYYAAVILGDKHQVAWGRFTYGVAALACCATIVLRRRRRSLRRRAPPLPTTAFLERRPAGD